MSLYAACHKLATALSKRLFSDHQQPVSDHRNFDVFFASYENPSLEGFGDSDEVGTDEIKEDLEVIKRASAYKAFYASRKVEDTNPNYNSDDDVVSVCEDGESLYTNTFTPSGFFAGRRLRKRVEYVDDVGVDVADDVELKSEASVGNYSEQAGSSKFTNEFDDSGYFVGRTLRRAVAVCNDDDDDDDDDVDVVESKSETSVGNSERVGSSQFTNCFDDSGFFVGRRMRRVVAVDNDDDVVVESTSESSVGNSEHVRSSRKLKRKACSTVRDDYRKKMAKHLC